MTNLFSDGNKKGTSAKGRNPNAGKTPQEIHTAEQIATIKAVSDIKEALERSQEWRQKVQEFTEQRQFFVAEVKKFKTAESAAVAGRDYALAQSHKESHDALALQLTAAKEKLERVVELSDAATARHAELFLADESAPYNIPEATTLTRIRVINPVTGDFASAAYTDSDACIQLVVDNKHFEDAAYNANSWAKSLGFVVRITSATVEL